MSLPRTDPMTDTTDTTKAAAHSLDGIMRDVRQVGLAGEWGFRAEGLHYEEKVRAAIESAIERAVAAERERCKDLCEAISDQYREREGLRYPELRTDAETGAGDCAAAIEALGATGEQHHD
jgi:hypothetical protein